ncbi:uncharacterized protein ARMOST_03761 [Armillaria ostoyae]|uniref:Uncharacterized protein n=1 Tax=Armillaria ostoyae TaxID=47428 RepID=A0A284QVD9_ARMOS|nr:uncharacterized protein ARMOST_03761 [Armillaria ostoyae]
MTGPGNGDSTQTQPYGSAIEILETASKTVDPKSVEDEEAMFSKLNSQRIRVRPEDEYPGVESLRSVRAYLVSLVGIFGELCKSGGSTSLIRITRRTTRSRAFYSRDTK